MNIIKLLVFVFVVVLILVGGFFLYIQIRKTAITSEESLIHDCKLKATEFAQSRVKIYGKMVKNEDAYFNLHYQTVYDNCIQYKKVPITTP